MAKHTAQEKADAQRFYEIRLRVASLNAASILWQDFLSAAQRTELGGDFGFAYGKLGTLRMWMTVTKKTQSHAFIDVAEKLDLISSAEKTWLRKFLKVSESGAESWNSRDGSKKPASSGSKGRLCVKSVAKPRICVRFSTPSMTKIGQNALLIPSKTKPPRILPGCFAH